MLILQKSTQSNRVTCLLLHRWGWTCPRTHFWSQHLLLHYLPQAFNEICHLWSPVLATPRETAHPPPSQCFTFPTQLCLHSPSLRVLPWLYMSYPVHCVSLSAEHRLQESRNFACCVHCCNPSTEHNTQHRVKNKYLLLRNEWAGLWSSVFRYAVGHSFHTMVASPVNGR